MHFTGRQGSDVTVTKGSRRVRGQVGREIMAESCEWHSKEGQQVGREGPVQRGTKGTNVGTKVAPS